MRETFGENIRSESTCDALTETPLSESELAELTRIQKALTFLRGSKESVSQEVTKADHALLETIMNEPLLVQNKEPSNSASTPESPRQIARFQIVELMGRGGFSEVYRYLDPNQRLNRDVAAEARASNVERVGGRVRGIAATGRVPVIHCTHLNTYGGRPPETHATVPSQRRIRTPAPTIDPGLIILRVETHP